MTKQELIEMLNKAQEAELAVGRMISIALPCIRDFDNNQAKVEL